MGRILTYRDSGSRDCDRPAGLAESVPEHIDPSLCIKEGMESQLLKQLTERRWGWGCGGMKKFTLERIDGVRPELSRGLARLKLETKESHEFLVS